jgi:hypothetical protein
MRPPWLSALVPLALPLAGCAEIHRNQVGTADEVVETRTEVAASSDFDAEVKQSSGAIIVKVRPKCALVEKETVETTTTYEQELDEGDEIWMTFLGVGGTLPLGGGIALLADSPSVYDSDVNGRLYNPTGQDAAVGLGSVLTLMGTAMIIPPLVNAFRAAGDDHETSTHERQGRVLRPSVACDGRQGGQSFSVTGRTQFGSTVGLGSVSAPTFESTIDLASVLGPNFFQTVPPPVSLGIWVNQKFVGEVDVRALAEAAIARQSAADELAWRTAEPEGCAKLRTDTACAGVLRYVSALPNGKHAVEAQQLLSRLVPGQPVVAVDPNLDRLDRARQAAADAAAAAEEKAALAAEAEAERVAQKAAEAQEKARKTACAEACARECKKDVDCKASCLREVCQ